MKRKQNEKRSTKSSVGNEAALRELTRSCRKEEGF